MVALVPSSTPSLNLNHSFVFAFYMFSGREFVNMFEALPSFASTNFFQSLINVLAFKKGLEILYISFVITLKRSEIYMQLCWYTICLTCTSLKYSCFLTAPFFYWVGATYFVLFKVCIKFELSFVKQQKKKKVTI